MKHILLKQLPVWVLACTMLSCAKQNAVPGTACLTLVNAVPGATPYLLTNFSGTNPITYYNAAMRLTYGTWATNNQTAAYSGETPLAIYRYPDTTSHSSPLFNLIVNLPAGSIHTLFLAGTLTAPDTLFTTDTPPYHPASDSSMGLRFVNLMPGSAPVSVNITGLANGSEVGSLSYKSITGFKNYPATYAVSHYKFEFRDAVSGTLINSLDVTGINNITSNNNRRFRNLTLALLGLPGDVTTWKVVLIETYTTT